jgi:hypothetical protein
MAYDPTVATPRLILTQSLLTGGGVWLYSSTDAHGDVAASGYFTGALDRGMKTGDIVIVHTSGSGATTLHSVTDITAGAATISAAVLS